MERIEESMQQKNSSLGNVKLVQVFAPASVGNVAVGFDVLGHALGDVGDTVTLVRSDIPGVRLNKISGVVTGLPVEAEKNTAGAAVIAMCKALGLEESGFEISIEKGIPLGSGMGGSAASAVGAVVALNQMLKIPLNQSELFSYALQGEAISSGEKHGDNVAASLLGGLTMVGPADEPRAIQIPVPNQLRCVLVHPDLQIETKSSRSALPKTYRRELMVEQTANLSAFIVGCFQRDLDLIEKGLKDVLIEPKRARFIPGFNRVKEAAIAEGAMGCSISGSGPSVFAWFRSESSARSGVEAMQKAFTDAGLETTSVVSAVNSPGARVL